MLVVIALGGNALLPRIGIVEVVAFVFSIFTVFGIPVYVWQQHARTRSVPADRVH
jgi:hypothetical protein